LDLAPADVHIIRMKDGASGERDIASHKALLRLTTLPVPELSPAIITTGADALLGTGSPADESLLPNQSTPTMSRMTGIQPAFPTT
jgi:hypothetical protein